GVHWPQVAFHQLGVEVCAQRSDDRTGLRTKRTQHFHKVDLLFSVSQREYFLQLVNQEEQVLRGRIGLQKLVHALSRRMPYLTVEEMREFLERSTARSRQLFHEPIPRTEEGAVAQV